MSLRIKLPAKVVETDSAPQSSTSELPSQRKKVVKRRIALDSDEEDEDPRRSSAPLSSPPQKSSIGERSRTADGDSDFDHEEEAAPEFDSPSLPTHPEASSSNIRGKKPKAKRTGNGPPPAKKKRVVISEPNSDHDYAHENSGASAVEEDDDFILEHKRPPNAVGKQKMKGAKGKAVAANAKGHSGKLRRDSMESVPVAGTKRQRAGQPSREDSTVDVVGLGDMDTTANATAARSPSQSKEPSPPPMKKRKLPTIKKIKGVNASAATTSKAALAGLAKGAIPVLPEVNKPAGVRQTPATAGNADFDLRNASVYRELFKPAGGSTPRSGINRREKDEERRRELNKMRDEARAKRLAEAKPPFDLQRQTDKILRFEEKLRADNSTALYPNFLAAKWREIYERERRRQQKEQQKEQEWSENRTWDEGGREEGEM